MKYKNGGNSMNEVFAKPAVGAIIEKEENGEKYILIQTRQKENAGTQNGMLEIPAGKIREYENIFDTLRREVMEETGLSITEIVGENDIIEDDLSGYKVITYSPFSITQNLSGGYSLIVQVFICKAKGNLVKETNETKDIHWITVDELKDLYINNRKALWPIHVNAIKKYLKKEKKYDT